MNRQIPANNPPPNFTNTMIFKIITIVFIILILLIPASMINSLIKEREQRKQEVIAEIGSQWGSEQTIVGPIISIPYKKYYTDEKKNQAFTISHAYFLPETLDVESRILSEKRYRGIYEVVLYNTHTTLSGNFKMPNPGLLGINSDNVVWQGTKILIGISDLRGIKKPIQAGFNGDSLVMNPGLGSDEIASNHSGVNSLVNLPEEGTDFIFKFDLDLNGSNRINFVPVGKQTAATIESDWPSPNFTGDFLPGNRTIDKNGFKASWTILDLNRNFPQSWIGAEYGNQNSKFGVGLYTPVDIYQKSTRTVKYALLFIVFAFIAFFFSEIMNKTRVHPIQYLLIGLAMILFYSLLISISEHTNFDIAYWISCLAIIGLITGYSRSVLKKRSMALTVGGTLFVLYGYLYIILQLENYALVMGSIGLFVVLGLVMYLTRKIDWYNLKFEK
jgi:inner membrane protein